MNTFIFDYFINGRIAFDYYVECEEHKNSKIINDGIEFFLKLLINNIYQILLIN